MPEYIWGSVGKNKLVHAFKTGPRMGMSEEEYKRSYQMRSVCGTAFADFKMFIEGNDGKRCNTCVRVAK